MKPATSTMLEVCEQLKCGKKKLYALIREEGFPKFGRVGRRNFFYDDAVEAWRRTRPDYFPPGCFADPDAQDLDELHPSMKDMLRKVRAEKAAQANADREREEKEKARAAMTARQEADEKEREQAELWEQLKPKEPEPPARTKAPHRPSLLNQRKVRATLKWNKAKLRKGK
jgi:predicted DNA-binding transcriptional regulator AlpA